jgi:hypothetical protein
MKLCRVIVPDDDDDAEAGKIQEHVVLVEVKLIKVQVLVSTNRTPFHS